MSKHKRQRMDKLYFLSVKIFFSLRYAVKKETGRPQTGRES
jgi:hypothetical protein